MKKATRKNIEEAKTEVEKYLRSGLSKQEYCAKTGINYNSLQWLHTRVKRYEQSGKKSLKTGGFTCIELKTPEELKTITIHYERIKIELPKNSKENLLNRILNTVKDSNV